MSRRSVFVAVSCVVLGLSVLGIVLVCLLRYQSRWYREAVLPPGPVRQKHSQDFVAACVSLYADLDSERGEWYGRFTADQINSYFEEGFRQSGIEARLMPDGISEPRVAFDTERIRLAFRYGRGLFSSVIQINLRVWKAAQEPNVVVVEVEGFRAGALPISARGLLEKLSEVGRQNGIGVSWFRDHANGHPVAVLRFEDNLPRPTREIQAVHLEPNVISVRGRPLDGSGSGRPN